MNIYKLKNGDIQLGDYRFRKNKRFTEVVYLITQVCNFDCEYCVGWHERIRRDTLIDKFSCDRVVDDFRYLEQNTGQQLYIVLTGGEPTLISNFVEFVRKLTKYFFVELQTNLCTKFIKSFAQRINPERIGQIQASYHSGILDKKPALKKLYLKNFQSLLEKKFSIALKIVAVPWRLTNLKNELAQIKNQFSEEFPILIQPFIDSRYPAAYSREEKEILSKLLKVRRTEGLDCINGAGYFKGMKCGAGSSFVMMDNFGNVYPCHSGFRTKKLLGNLANRDIQFYEGPQPCPVTWCGTVLRALWYGENPWDYIHKNREECKYCRFA